MTPLAAVAFAIVVSVPPVAPDGGLDDGATNGVYVAANTRVHPHSATDPDGGDGPHPCCLYVHSLDRPAVPVDGLDPAFLVESVPIARCESTHREAAVNASGATGLLQVMLPLHLPKAQALGYTSADMLRAEPNLRVAHVIWQRQGWKPWSCYRP